MCSSLFAPPFVVPHGLVRRILRVFIVVIHMMFIRYMAIVFFQIVAGVWFRLLTIAIFTLVQIAARMRICEYHVLSEIFLHHRTQN